MACCRRKEVKVGCAVFIAFSSYIAAAAMLCVNSQCSTMKWAFYVLWVVAGGALAALTFGCLFQGVNHPGTDVEQGGGVLRAVPPTPAIAPGLRAPPVQAAAAASAQALDSVEFLDRMLDYLCHEVRNPVHTLRNSLPEEEVHPDINRALTHMMHVLDVVQDYRALAAGAFSLVPTRVDTLKSLLYNILREQATSNRGLRWQIRLPAAVGAIVDSRRLAQIVRVGMRNARRFGRPGSVVRVTCHIAREVRPGKSGYLLMVDIANVGVTPLAVPTAPLFQAFRRVVHGAMPLQTATSTDQATSNEFAAMTHSVLASDSRPWSTMNPISDSADDLGATLKGSGTSLSMSRLIARCMDGWVDLWVAANGTTHFTAWVGFSGTGVSLAQATLQTVNMSGRDAAVDVSAVDFLVVDDDMVSLRIATRMLGIIGAPETAITTADSSETAIATTNQAVDGRDATRPLVILLDIIMEDTNAGINVMEALASQRDKFKAIAMTEDVSPASLHTYAEVGFVGVLAKPFDKERMQEALHNALAGLPFFIVS